MNTTTQYLKIHIADIDLTDSRYSLVPFPATAPEKELQEEINTYGILQPPLLLECDDNRFIVVSGKKRIQAAAATESTTITSLVISRDQSVQQLYVFGALLRHQLMGSQVSIIEQAVFFKKALDSMPAEDVLSFLPLMGYKAKSHIPDELVSLLQLTPRVQLCLHRGSLSQRTGKKLLRFSPADQQALATLVEELQLGGSKQQKLIDQVLELTKRERINAVELLGNWLEQEKDTQANGPQRAASLLKWLQQKCSPRSVDEEGNFTKFCQQLQLPQGVKAEHTLSFEDDRVTLSIDFSSREQLKEKWPRIKSALLEEQKS